MRKSVIVLFTLISLSSLFAEQSFYQKEELVHTFSSGKGENELGYISSSDSIENTPVAMTISSDNELIISDRVNRRVIYYNADYTVKRIYNLKDSGFTLATPVVDIKTLIWASLSDAQHFIVNKNTGKSTEIKIPWELSLSYNSVVTDKVLFTYLKDGSLCSFVLENREDMIYSPRKSEEETLEMFDNKQTFALEDYSIDHKKRIFYKGVIQNRNYVSLYDYWKGKHEEYNETDPKKDHKILYFENLKNVRPLYSGTDSDGNTYWWLGKNCLIMNNEGWAEAYIQFKKKPSLRPAVTPEGDLFLLRTDYKEGVFNLYRIERNW